MDENSLPISRRPIAAGLRRTATAATRWCVSHRVHPDAVSYGSIVVSTMAGVGFWLSGDRPWLVIPAVILCYLRLWLNMLDGMVALASGKASRRGDMLNEMPDRASDVVIFVGVAHSGLCHPLTAYWVIILALLTAYVGTFGQAVGVGRQFGGVMAKPWRVVALHLGAWLTLGLLWADRPMQTGLFTVLDWTHVLIIVGCLQTIVIRLSRIWRRLEGA